LRDVRAQDIDAAGTVRVVFILVIIRLRNSPGSAGTTGRLLRLFSLAPSLPGVIVFIRGIDEVE
jgi:hypothetical protein